jgi:peptidoglycan/LPS O-acetylase OafA/YrhL
LKRIIRIYPAYIIAILAYWALDVVLSVFSIEGFFESYKAVWKHLILVEGQEHFWSIPTEMKYYLLSPIIIFVLYSAFKFEILKSSIVILLLIIIATFWERYYGLPYMSAFRYSPIFLVGMWLAIFSVNMQSVVSLKLINILSLVSMFILVLTMPYCFKGLTGAAFDYGASYLFLPYTALWGVVLIAVLKGSIVMKFFELRFFRLIGVISFSLYLYHWPFLVLIRNFPYIPLEEKGFLAVFLNLIIGACMYLLVDRTLQRNRKRFLIN